MRAKQSTAHRATVSSSHPARYWLDIHGVLASTPPLPKIWRMGTKNMRNIRKKSTPVFRSKPVLSFSLSSMPCKRGQTLAEAGP